VVIDSQVAAMRDIEADVSFQNRAEYDGAGRETVRGKVAADLGVSPDEIALVRNTSEGNNVIAGGLPLGQGDEVVVFDQNHPTASVAWDVRARRFGFSVVRVSVPVSASSPEQVFEVFRAAFTPRTRALVFSDVSNTTGIRVPTVELCRLARERGAHVHVDGAQTWGALALDLRAMGCDSFAASAHKWPCGPKEVGVLYVRNERVADIWPGSVGVGWGNSAETSAVGARKFETLGQRNDALITALGAAMDYRRALGPSRIENRVRSLAASLRDMLLAIPGSSAITPAGAEMSAGVLVTRFAGADHRRLYELLYERYGISGAATGGLRLCAHIYATLADVERAAEAVRGALRELA
jgi:selenocysteine lyase/cysteine desulfurase